MAKTVWPQDLFCIHCPNLALCGTNVCEYHKLEELEKDKRLALMELSGSAIHAKEEIRSALELDGIKHKTVNFSPSLTFESVAEMTSKCNNIDWDGSNYYASLWCNITGDYVIGNGKTILNAVLNAHARVKSIEDC